MAVPVLRSAWRSDAAETDDQAVESGSLPAVDGVDERAEGLLGVLEEQRRRHRRGGTLDLDETDAGGAVGRGGGAAGTDDAKTASARCG